MNALNVKRTAELKRVGDGQKVRVAGCVTLSRAGVTIVGEPFLLVAGVLQDQQGTISVRARQVEALLRAIALTRFHRAATNWSRNYGGGQAIPHTGAVRPG